MAANVILCENDMELEEFYLSDYHTDSNRCVQTDRKTERKNERQTNETKRLYATSPSRAGGKTMANLIYSMSCDIT